MLVDTHAARGLYEAIRSDYTELVEKELDTDAEIEKQGRLTKNFKALLEQLSSAPGDVQEGIRDVLTKLGKWDVYAFWFKEVKDLVVAVRGVLDLCKGMLEPPAGGPQVGSGAASPAAQVPARPVPPKAPARPTPPGAPAPAPASTTPAGPAETGGQGRTLPVLKPVFKVASKAPPVTEPPATLPQVGEVTGTPVPLRAVLEGGTKALHVKPARLIKPIVGVIQPGGLPTSQGAGDEQVPASRPVSPLPAKEASASARPAAVASNPFSLSPAGASTTGVDDNQPAVVKPVLAAAKPLRIPKPVKISIPSLDGIDIDTEIAIKPVDEPLPGVAPGSGAGKTDPVPASQGAVRLTSIPVRINVQAPGTNPSPDDRVIDEIAGEVMSRIATGKGERKEETPPAQAAGPVRFRAIPRPVPADDAPAIAPAQVEAISRILDSGDGWDEEAIGAVLDGDAGETPVLSPSGPGADKEPAGMAGDSSPVLFSDSLLRAKPAQAPGSQGGAPAGLLSVFSAKEPFPARKDAGKKDAKATKEEAVEPPKASQDTRQPAVAPSADLFAGALASRTRGLSPAPSRIPLFGEASPSRAAEPVTPIGSDVDLDSLPDTKDGLYQTLIALEGKRYSLERARKDLRVDLDRGIIKDAAYQQRVNELKVELDGISARIKEIRDRIKGA